jgi:DNA helicase-2/ATP-dependent DNA helicase PcrA
MLRSITLNRLKSFMDTIERFRELSSSMNAYALSKTIVDELDYFEYLRRTSNNANEAENRIENIVELLGSIKDFVDENEDNSLEAYLSAVSLKTDIDEWNENSGKVSLMTAHTAKGLEFPVVIIIGVADTVFPHFRSLTSREQIEEERRLLHVAITRAKEEVYITFPEFMHTRQQPLEPSPFLDELPEDAVVWIGEEAKEKRERPESRSENISVQPFRPGDIVYHQFFGNGEILRIENGKAIVRFSSGLKTLVLKYAHLSKI